MHKGIESDARRAPTVADIPLRSVLSSMGSADGMRSPTAALKAMAVRRAKQCALLQAVLAAALPKARPAYMDDADSP